MNLYLSTTGLQILILARVESQIVSPVFESIETCCGLGSDWAEIEEHGCDDFQVPVKDIIPEMQATCISTMEVCCTKTRREQQCALGQEAALNGEECGLTGTQDKVGAETYKDCCLSCTLGIIVASMAQKCSGMSAVFGCPLEKPFADCCQEILGPLNITDELLTDIPENLLLDDLEGSTPDAPEDGEGNTPDIEITTFKTLDDLTTEEDKNSQCPSGFQYNAMMNVCDDTDEVNKLKL